MTVKNNITEKFPYIVIEGPIGSGKTTLARKLSERFPVNLLLEKAEANPFLARFYQDPERYALPRAFLYINVAIKFVTSANMTCLVTPQLLISS
jgi:deoxyadenosine/deoxycytidine kinase